MIILRLFFIAALSALAAAQCGSMTGISASQLTCVFPQLSASKAAQYAPIMTEMIGSTGATTTCQWAAMLGNIGTESNGLTEWTQVPCDSSDDAPYCGRGPLQITGRPNYSFCSTNEYCPDCGSIVSSPQEVSNDANVGFQTAACVWGSVSGRNLNSYADGSLGGFEDTAELINCGHLGCTPNGWASRQQYWHAANSCLN